MRRVRFSTFLGMLLVLLSALLFVLHWAAFHDPRTLTFYLWLDVIFLPIQVLIATLIVDRFIAVREKRAMLNKLNMVIGAFFSEAGTDLIEMFQAFDAQPASTAGGLADMGKWSDREFESAATRLKGLQLHIDSRRGDLAALKAFLLGKREFLLRLLENPNLLEHESFTDLLWAVHHLTEELHERRDLKSLPSTDLDHLSGDTRRAYGFLIVEWVSYMRHLKTAYPYLFSLAVRTNPFDPTATVEVK